MSIGWLRDLFIIISSIVAIGALIFFSILILLIYRRAKASLSAVLSAAEAVQTTTLYVKNEVNLARPIAQALAIIDGIRKGIEIVNNFTKKH